MRAFYLDDYAQQAKDGWEGWTETLSAQGLPLDDRQTAYIESLKKQQERRGDDVRAYEIMNLHKQNGEIPDDYAGEPNLALYWLKQYTTGKINKEQYESYFIEYKNL